MACERYTPLFSWDRSLGCQSARKTFQSHATPRLDSLKERAAPRAFRVWASFSTTTLSTPASRVEDAQILSTKVSGRQAKATLRGGLQSPCMRIMPACASFSHGGWEMRCDGCAHDSVQGESRGPPAGLSPWETMCQEQLRDANSLIIC